MPVCLTTLYVGHLRSFVYDVVAKTKHKITMCLIFLNVYTYVLYSLVLPAEYKHFSHLRGKQSVTALYSFLLGQSVTAVL